jgi:hypothetical protein
MKAIPVFYSLVQPFPPEYFRQEISFYDKLPIAGSYLLRQGLFYMKLFFIGNGSLAKEPLAFCLNPGDSFSFFAILNFMISIEFDAKN